ncbi:MAG: 4-alpha-glucanotransferase [Candidatus Peregrinibacteria bacterium Greene1014_49]|nr:MAG: 4-alpha-glucanotransferase [Candidatus Peregrinibacteria bacterium Greene1014_49]
MSLHSLMFGWEYPPLHLGGLGVACQGLVQGLLRNGVKVTLVLPHGNKSAEREVTVLSTDDFSASTMTVPSMLQPYDTHASYDIRVSNICREECDIYGGDIAGAIENYTAASVQVSKNITPNVVHCHDWMTYGAGARASQYHRVPLVAHIHATELDRTNFKPNEWIYGFEKRGFQAADRIIAVSKYTKNMLTEHYGIPADKISVVHNGASEHLTSFGKKNTISLHGRKHAPMVLFLGRLVLQKGPKQFLDMARIIHQKNPDVQFCVAGDGDMLSEMITYAIQQGLSECVLFTGKVESREVSELYRRASCFVMPSLSEPFGLVALEAAAHGTPVVISKQSGVREVLDHAFTVDFWDTEKMADCVMTILREKPLAMQLRSESSRAITHLTWQHQAEVVRSIYQQLITT